MHAKQLSKTQAAERVKYRTTKRGNDRRSVKQQQHQKNSDMELGVYTTCKKNIIKIKVLWFLEQFHTRTESKGSLIIWRFLAVF